MATKAMCPRIEKRYDKNKALTTGDMGKFASMSKRTIAKFIDQGLIACYRVPGSNDRRVQPNVFRDFLVKHGFPTGQFDMWVGLSETNDGSQI